MAKTPTRFVAAAALGALLFTGCHVDPRPTEAAEYQDAAKARRYANRMTETIWNLEGGYPLYYSNSRSFEEVPITSFTMNSNDHQTRLDVSGDTRRYLFGWFSYTDH